jgi:TRAP-type C4-dicarboxylate transport system permease small subunit
MITSGTIFMQKIFSFLNSVLNAIGSMALVLIMVLTVADAIANNIFKSPITSATEIITSAMPLCVFGFLLATTISKRHIWIDLFVSLMGSKLQKISRVICLILSILLFAFLTYLTIPFTAYSCSIGECTGGTIPVPLWPAKVLITVSIALGTLHLTLELWRELRT